MVEAATGELIEQIVQRNVLDPADMVNTRYLQDPSLGNPFLAGGLVSTPGDYRLFLNALIGGRIVHAAETLDEIFSDAHPEASKDGFLAVLAARYGLGELDDGARELGFVLQLWCPLRVVATHLHPI